MAVGWPPLHFLQFNLLSQVSALCFGFIGCKHLKQHFTFIRSRFYPSKSCPWTSGNHPIDDFLHSLYIVISQLNQQIFPLILIHMLQPFLILFSCQCTVLCTASLENTGSSTIRFSALKISVKSVSSGSFPCFLLISKNLLDHLSLVPPGILDRSMHIISGVSKTFHVCVYVMFLHLSKKLWNFICFSMSWFDLWPLLDLFVICCDHSVWISIQRMHHLLCSLISFLWRKLYAIFDHFL